MRAVSFGARFSISLSSGIRMTASVYLGEIYCTLVGSSTEAKRNRTFAIFQQKNKRQSAVSLIQFTLIRYSRLCAIKKYRFKPNSPRQTPPREHSNATTKAYALPRDCSVKMGDTKSVSYQPNSTASRNSQRCGV